MGQALKNLGFPEELLREADSKGIAIHILINGYSDKFELDMSFSSIDYWFYPIQSKQDSRKPWGECIK